MFVLVNLSFFILPPTLLFRLSPLDGLVHRDALYDGPRESGLLDLTLALLDLVQGPNEADRDVGEARHHTSRTRLHGGGEEIMISQCGWMAESARAPIN
jgi:hypothetical protein